LSADGGRVRGLGILDSSGRAGRSLADILASHALIHTADGEHYRTALAAAAATCGLGVVRVAARDLARRATEVAGGREVDALLKRVGRDVGPPWAADQKNAALLGFIVLEGGRLRS
jgi:hypothetical protein